MLGQSEQEIKKVTNELAGSKGATDKARTAMQSFSLSLKQLQGTLDSIGVTMGKVAATALLPFIAAANVITGAISALPGPVKDLTAALLLLAGAYVTVRVGALAFGAALRTEAVIAARAEVLRLGVALRATLVQDLAVARAGVAAFFRSLNPQGFRAAVTALAGFAATARVNLAAGMAAGSAAVLSLSQSLAAAAQSGQQAQAGLSGLSAVLNRGVVASSNAASGALLGVSRSLSALSAGTVTAGLGALAIALAGVAAAVVSYNVIMSDANKTTQAFRPAINKLEADMKKLGVPIADTTALGGPFNRFMKDAKGSVGGFVQSLVPIPGPGNAVAKALDMTWKSLSIVGIPQVTETVARLATGLKQLYDTARKNQNIVELENGMNKISAQATLATNETAQLISTLRSMPSGREIDKGLNEKLIQNRANLEKNREALVQVRDALRQMAAAAKAAGDTEYAEELEARSKRTSTEIGLIDILNTKLQQQTDARKKSAEATKAETLTLDELNKALKRREQSNQLGILEAEANMLKRVAAGNLSAGEAAEQKRALVVDGLRSEIALLDESITKLSAVDQASADGLALKQQRAQKAVELYQAEIDATRKRVDAERELNSVIAAAPGRTLQSQAAAIDGQIQGVTTLLSLGKALADLDQSRFNIAKSFNQYELSKLQERGASEGALRAKRREGEAIELAALQQRIRQQEVAQGIELKILSLTQRKAQIEAQMAVNTARVDLLEREQALQDAINSGDQAAAIRAQQSVALARDKLGLSQQSLGLIEKLQPLEAATVLATQQTARNQLAAEAAARGYGVAVDGSLRKVAGTVGQFDALATITAKTAAQQEQLARFAARTGFETRKTADGTIEIGRAIKDSRSGARGLAGSFVTLGDQAPGAADSTNQFAGYLQQGQGFVKGIVDLNLPGAVNRASAQASGLAGEMGRAANAADRFYDSLRLAAGLPAARWAGGPVAPGQTVRINDGPGGHSLGQESFLSSSGKLSLINRPANSLWAAPSRGLVVPASVTEQLKAAGAFGPVKAITGAAPRISTGDPGTAALAVEVSQLRVEVGELRRKRWDVHVNLKQDGSGLRMQRLMNGIR